MNQQLFTFFFTLAHRSSLLDALIIFGARDLAYLLGLLFLIIGFALPDWRRKLFFLGEGVLAVILSRGIITEIIRHFYIHPRPFDALGITSLIPESGNSFPSGHMTFFFALTGILFFWSKKWGTVFGILSFVMGIARVVSGVHWPADILGGAIIGILSGWAIHTMLRSSRSSLNQEQAVRL